MASGFLQTSDGLAIPTPFVAAYLERHRARGPWIHPYFTDLEVAAGFIATFRVGANPGELIDFLLGWTTLDIFSDDLEARNKKQEKSNQRIETDG